MLNKGNDGAMVALSAPNAMGMPLLSKLAELLPGTYAATFPLSVAMRNPAVR